MLASPRNFLRFLAALALTCSLAAPADAAVITQTQNQNFNVNTGVQNLSWNQFNPALGTLLSVEYFVNGTLTGSFQVQNQSANASITARNSQTFMFTQFLGAGAPAAFAGGTLAPISTTPLTDLAGTSIAPSSTQIFTLTGPQALTVPSTNLTPSAAYFTGLGTVNSNIEQLPSVNVTGGVFQVDMSGLNVNGIATLIYRYEDGIAAVPEPSTVAFAGFGLLAFAAKRFRSKKRAKSAPVAA